MAMTCPKCDGSMRQYERSGVTVDQCSECRGIFLDRGELERLIDAETAWHTAPDPRYATPDPRYATPGRGYGEPQGYDRRRHGHDEDDHRGHGGYPHRKRKSFLEELFD